MNLIGNYTALVTPFKKNNDIDYSSLKFLCNFQTNNFSDGIVALGSTAEATALDSYEKHKVLQTIIEHISNKIPVIAGINAFTLTDALYQCEARFLDGADALLISPPPYIKPTQKGILNFYSFLADHSLIPIILYNIPSRTCVNIDVSVVSQLSHHPNIIGIKDAGGDITYTQNIIYNTQEQDFFVLAGNDNQLLPMLSVGASGIISVAGNIIPDIMHDIVCFYKNDQFNNAKKLYFENLDLINSLSLESNPICIKYALSKLGFIKNNLRMPLTKLSTKNAKTIINIIKNKFVTNI